MLILHRPALDYYGPGQHADRYYLGDHRYTGETRETCNPESAAPIAPADAPALLARLGAGWTAIPYDGPCNGRGLFD